MSKQTVEEAAKLSHDKNFGKATLGILLDEYEEKDREKEYIEAFKDGAAWQKEQGIEWISIGDGVPVNKFNEVGIRVLVTDGGHMRTCPYWFSTNHFSTTMTVTHWAYINLPKTDK